MKGHPVRKHVRRIRKTGTAYVAGRDTLPPNVDDIIWLYRCSGLAKASPVTTHQLAADILRAQKEK